MAEWRNGAEGLCLGLGGALRGVPRQGRGAGHGSQLGKGEQCMAEPLRGKLGEETNGVGVGWVFLHGESCACARGSQGTIYDLRKLSCAGTREYQLPVAALLILRGWGTAPYPPGGLGTCSELGEGACSEPGLAEIAVSLGKHLLGTVPVRGGTSRRGVQEATGFAPSL